MNNDEKIIELLTKQEKHQRYFSTALTIYIVLQVIGVIALLFHFGILTPI